MIAVGLLIVWILGAFATLWIWVRLWPIKEQKYIGSKYVTVPDFDHPIWLLVGLSMGAWPVVAVLLIPGGIICATIRWLFLDAKERRTTSLNKEPTKRLT